MTEKSDLVRLLPGLYLVGTPIGNLLDMSPRAIETLQSADLIACEDTRVFAKLATHFDIKTPRESYENFSEAEKCTELADKIAAGAAIALTSDAGMPTISDPGFRLVRECRGRGISVFAVPGPTAAMTAVALSGFPTDRFTFCGFYRDEKHLREDNHIRHTLIYYESPNRISATIADMARVMPERRIAIVREMTKVYEETIIGYPADLLARDDWRGEIVIVVEPAPDIKMSDTDIKNIVNDILQTDMPTRAKAAEIAARTGLRKSDAYDKIVKQTNK